MKIKVLSVFVVFIMLFFFCGRDGGERIIPEAGEWTDGDISFFVSTDGSELTGTGSTLEQGASLIVRIPINQNPYGVVAIIFYRYVDIPISDEEFDYSDDDIDVEGTFTSNTSANGTASCTAYSSAHNYTFTGSMSWDAEHPLLATPEVTYEARDNGGTLRLSWSDVADAEGYYIYADGQKIDSTTNNTYDATTPAAVYEVSAYADDMESRKAEIDCTPVTTSNITVWGNSDPSPDHPSGIGFTESGECVTIAIGDPSNWPYIDAYFDDVNFADITLVSPNEHVPPYNNENNTAKSAGLIDFDALEIAAEPSGLYSVWATLYDGYVYSLWTDPDDDGWDNTNDHFGKMKVEDITGSTAPYMVEITVAAQLIPGLRWLVTE